MNWSEVILYSQWFFILFFIGINLGYLSLNLISLFTVYRYMQWRDIHNLPQIFSGVEPSVSLLAPAYNEEATIASSIQSLLQLSYPDYEVIVINDGSKDNTLDILKREFDLIVIPETPSSSLVTRKVITTYRSKIHPNLKVIDKENGGKADALNVGLNFCHSLLYCCIDADSILERNSLQRVIEPFLEDPSTIATGGTVRIANGCQVREGYLTQVGLPRNPLALFQIVEYLRAFLFGRMGWSALNGMLIISGAFGVFKKDVVIEIGGYRTDTVGEDMELVARLHRHMRQQKKPYRICFVPDPICWTEAPEDLKTLKNQRVRWQRGLSESLSKNISLLFHPKGGFVGWVAFPFMILFEWLEPFIQVVGYSLTIAAYFLGLISGAIIPPFLCYYLTFASSPYVAFRPSSLFVQTAIARFRLDANKR